nr:MAG TPA: hypothetical protein [Caudoviricetes sp.]
MRTMAWVIRTGISCLAKFLKTNYECVSHLSRASERIFNIV